jgi:probable HAF family extracellular repeat protein
VTSCKAVLSLAVLLLAPLALAQGTYTQIDYPGSILTVASGIDTAGDIVGSYADPTSRRHGFLLSGGVYTTIDYPGAQDTYTFGLNDLGQIVGGDNYVGFIYDIGTRAFTTLSFPVQKDFTTAAAINNAGTVVGYVQVNQGSGAFLIGFELVGASYLKVLPRGYLYSTMSSINNSGKAVGIASTSSAYISFLFDETGSSKFQPLGIAPSAFPVAINDTNGIVGSYSPSTGITKGFVYQNSTFQPLVFPAPNSFTTATGINNSGEVVGYFFDASNIQHGFTWTPPADAAKK